MWTVSQLTFYLNLYRLSVRYSLKMLTGLLFNVTLIFFSNIVCLVGTNIEVQSNDTQWAHDVYTTSS